MADIATLTLTEFLLARIAEDEATDMGMPHRDSCRSFGGWPGDPESAVDCSCGVMARVGAECEAKRRIVAECIDLVEYDTNDHGILGERIGMESAVSILATVYADHPDYREEWRADS